MVRSLRAAAMAATILGVPAFTRLADGLEGRVVTAGGKRGEKEGGANRRAGSVHPSIRPVEGQSHDLERPQSEAGDLFAVERAELRQFGDEGACGDRPNAGSGGDEVLLLAPSRGAADGSVNIRIDLGQFFLERRDEAGDALFDVPVLDAPLPIALGDDDLDDLPAPRDEIGEQLGRFVGERAPAWSPRRSWRSSERRSDRSWRAGLSPGRNDAPARD
jgi:hypothetical protein